MIASFTHRFIFIKTRKTAGTSVEIVLSAWCEGRDICSLISPDDELIRHRYGAVPRNYCLHGELEARFLAAVRMGDRNEIRRAHRLAFEHSRFRNHMPAVEIAANLPDLWKSAFKFTVDRHPYERVISMAHWRLGRSSVTHGPQFSDFVDRIIDSERHVNHGLYLIDGRVGVDAVYRYEEIWSRIADLGRKLGKSMPVTPTNAKAGYRVAAKPAGTMLSDRQKARVQEQCRWEFENLGYKP